jgi:hypothetical protein
MAPVHVAEWVLHTLGAGGGVGGVGGAGGDGGGGGAGVGGKQTLAKHLKLVPTFVQAASVPSHGVPHTEFASSQFLPQKQFLVQTAKVIVGQRRIIFAASIWIWQKMICIDDCV